jgi:cyclopropane-fatty-acyl-phospholipid synthase
VHYHYDVSNAFYALFLDPEMVYSCAYFRDWNNDLATAQRDKLDMICRKLRPAPARRMLDIGCGWGALVCHAASITASAHGVTLARGAIRYREGKGRAARPRRTGDDRVARLFADRRRVRQDRLDRHVRAGRHRQSRRISDHPPAAAAARLYLHHTIARAPRVRRLHGPQAHPAENCALRYIFPGGELDHLGMSIANLERYGFEVHDVEAWREHYARTTRLWHDGLLANRAAAEREVGSVKTRLWLAYLAGARSPSNAANVGIFQTLVSKRARGASGLPPHAGGSLSRPLIASRLPR